MRVLPEPRELRDPTTCGRACAPAREGWPDCIEALRLTTRWVPAGADPQPASAYQGDTIQIQCDYRHSPLRRLPLNDRAAVDPDEMLLPHLPARVEQADNLTREWIETRHLIALMLVAERAREPEVGFLGRPADRLGDDVLNLHKHTDHPLLGEAVAATILPLRRDKLAQSFGDVGLAHGAASRLEIS